MPTTSMRSARRWRPLVNEVLTFDGPLTARARTDRFLQADGAIPRHDRRMSDSSTFISVTPYLRHPDGDAADPGAGGPLLIIGVTDVDAQYRHIQDAGVAIDPPKDEEYGPRSCHLSDPWGYQWYFWEGDAVYPPDSESLPGTSDQPRGRQSDGGT